MCKVLLIVGLCYFGTFVIGIYSIIIDTYSIIIGTYSIIIGTYSIYHVNQLTYNLCNARVYTLSSVNTD